MSALTAAKAIVSSAVAQVGAAIAGADPKPLQMTATVVELPQVVVPAKKTVVPSIVSGVTAAAPSVKAGDHSAAQFSGLRLANPDRDSLATARTAEATRVVSRSPIRPATADAAMADLFATRERSLADDIGDDFSSDVHHEAKRSQATADLALELALAEFTSGIQ
ncbi:MAG: hypothetical protein L0Z07_01105 [Planctomycetes bacterium]|nr:hypothetical protein [Planctomycetota bacterium]